MTVGQDEETQRGSREPKRRSRGERAGKKPPAVAGADEAAISAPPGLDVAPNGSNPATKKPERAERELYYPPVKETATVAAEAAVCATKAHNLLGGSMWNPLVSVPVIAMLLGCRDVNGAHKVVCVGM